MSLTDINSPQDLRRLSPKELPALAQELREFIVDAISRCGGHLASSLGVVDLSVALHYCFDTPKDCVIWDVGHQCYAHKILTGRKDRFETIRKCEGISGFPLRGESEYDVFSTGHSSTAVSLALGLAAARDFEKRTNKIIAVIGDGSLSGGMCFEALNNAGHLKKDIIVILNTNEMSISPAVGALSSYLNKIISKPVYNRFKTAFEQLISQRIPRLGPRLLKLSLKFEEVLKGLLVPGIFFEELGFRYFGPLDGHDLEELVPTLRNLKSLPGPILLHVVTKKGKGFKPAENYPERFHSIGRFDKKTGIPVTAAGKNSFTHVFSRSLIKVAQNDERIVAITAAMAEGTGLDSFSKKFPQRFFDVGIAEGHALAFASGLAAGGRKPVVAIYSTFLQRAYDQIMIDVALQNVNVVIAVDRAGVVGADGVTHQGIFDIAYLRTVPNMNILAPKDGFELESMLSSAFLKQGPVAIRFPKANVCEFARSEKHDSDVFLPEVIFDEGEIALVALGSMVFPSYKACLDLLSEGLNVKLINARSAKPLDEDFYKKLAQTSRMIFTIEEGVAEGGFGQALKCMLSDKTTVEVIGLPTDFIAHGQRDEILERFGLTSAAICQRLKSAMLSFKGA